jgi:hypothetical protein
MISICSIDSSKLCSLIRQKSTSPSSMHVNIATEAQQCLIIINRGSHQGTLVSTLTAKIPINTAIPPHNLGDLGDLELSATKASSCRIPPFVSSPAFSFDDPGREVEPVSRLSATSPSLVSRTTFGA